MRKIIISIVFIASVISVQAQGCRSVNKGISAVNLNKIDDAQTHFENAEDIEILRLHYAHTLSHWYNNVIKNKDRIIETFDNRFFKMWEFYLLASKYSFINMGNVVFQIQISKNINSLPLTRNYIYN